MIDPGSNPTGLSKKFLRELAGSAENFPKCPPNLPQKGFSAQLRATVSKEENNAARSQKLMEIPAITSETLTTLKP